MISVFHIAICMKPVEGTYANNALDHDVAGLNIDGCRVGTFTSTTPSGYDRLNKRQAEFGYRPGEYQQGTPPLPTSQGRWPANIVHDGSEEVMDEFPETKSGAMKRRVGPYEGEGSTGFLRGDSGPQNQHGDEGSAARFFHDFGVGGDAPGAV